MTTLPASILKSGVGMPDVWLGTFLGGFEWRFRANTAGDEPVAWGSVELDERQTYTGVLRRLAMWCGDFDGDAQAYWLDVEDGDLSKGWCLRSFRVAPVRHYSLVWRDRTFQPLVEPVDPITALIAIVTYIGYDHAIRRALGEDPERGTLGLFDYTREEGWVMNGTPVPGGNHTDYPHQALSAIHTEMTR